MILHLLSKYLAKTNSTSLYKNIETYSKQSKFKTFVYRLIFKPVTPETKKKDVRKKTYKNLIQKPYGTFEGKIIRNINVVTFDPFGYSVTDTIVADRNFVLKAGKRSAYKNTWHSDPEPAAFP